MAVPKKRISISKKKFKFVQFAKLQFKKLNKKNIRMQNYSFKQIVAIF